MQQLPVPLIVALSALLAVLSHPAALDARAAEPVVLDVRTPMAPPSWALLERELLRANAAACELFYNRYFDDRGWLLCVERWGGDDGPDGVQSLERSQSRISVDEHHLIQREDRVGEELPGVLVAQSA